MVPSSSGSAGAKVNFESLTQRNETYYLKMARSFIT